jgi:hypothetical protein
MPFSTFLAIALVASAATAAPLRVAPAGKAGARCTIHVAGLHGENETSRPCDAPIERPERPSMIWIEDGARISFPIAFDSVRDRDEVVLPLVRAVAVRVRAPEAQRTITVIRLPDANGRSFRRVAAGPAVLLPEGEVLAFESDGRGRVMAITRPVVAKADVAVELPRADRDVVAIVDWPETASDRNVRFVLHDGEEDARPAVAFADEAGALAVWYAHTRDRALLSAEGEDLALPKTSVVVERNAVSTIRAQLRRRPQLKVDVAVPDEAIESVIAARPFVRVTTVAENRVVAETAVTPRAPALLKKMPMEPLTAELRIGNVRYRENVDLTSRDEGSITFKVTPIRVDGSVRMGEQAIRAKVGFRTGIGDLSSVETDERGEYAIVLWNPDRYVLEVQPQDGGGRAPYSEMLVLSTSRRLDIVIPSGVLHVRVIDAATGKPIAAAVTTGMSRWNDPDHTGSRGRSFHAKADASGRAVVRLLRTGTAEVRASAAGYRDSEIVRVPIVEGGTAASIDIALRRYEAEAALRLLLPDGTPGAGAEVFAAADAAGERALFSGIANGKGEVELPSLTEGAFVFIRHRYAGATVRRWQAGMNRDPWLLARPAPRLNVQVKRRGGGSFSTAFLAVSIDGHWITGPALEFLTRGRAWVDANGVWIVDGLPALSLRILAWRTARAATSTYDALASLVPFPWSSPVVIETVD